MANPNHPMLHECDFCQKMIIGYSDEQKEAIGVVLSSGEQILTERVKLDHPHQSLSSELSYLRKRNTVLFDLTIEEIRTAAASGCALCTWLIQYIPEDHEFKTRVTRGAKQTVSSFTLAAEIRGQNQSLQFGIPKIHIERRQNRKHLGDEEEMEDVFISIDSSGIPLCQMVAATDSSKANDIQVRPINFDPKSESAFQLARGWLTTCLNTHQKCSKSVGQFMPTRLVEIEVRQGWPVLRLQESRQRKVERYASLSYCWGGEQKVKTTLSSIRRHQTRINIQDLPETIQGAIFVTLELGLRFIWVDALCIVQDDPLDKEIEIASMPSVYSQATVTITASRAKSAEEGFLQDRVLDIPYAFKLPYKCPSGEVDAVIFFPKLKESNEPLDQRGWALQERLLSTRILDYGSLQTRWTCEENRPSADHADWWVDGWKLQADEYTENDGKWFREILKEIDRDVRLPSDINPTDFSKHMERWERIVTVYTQRYLTSSSDRLPAISGIAERFQKILQDIYCAGLWKSDLPRGLLWRSRAPLPRPVVYQGPSWSWAAVDGPIKFISSRSKAIDSGFQFIECNIDCNPMAKFGSVHSGSLVVMGRVKPAEWVPGNKIRVQPGVLASDIYADALEVGYAPDGNNTVFLLMILSAASNFDDPEGLVLRKLESQKYSRIAAFRFSSARQIQWLNDCEPQIITII